MAAKSLSTTETERTICSNSDGKEPNHIATTVKRKVVGKRQLFMWMTQMIASLSWFFACLIYKSYDHGDIWQFVSFFFLPRAFRVMQITTQKNHRP